jgi:hypothetical protein
VPATRQGLADQDPLIALINADINDAKESRML